MVRWELTSVAAPHGTQGLRCRTSFPGRCDEAPQMGGFKQQGLSLRPGPEPETGPGGGSFPPSPVSGAQASLTGMSLPSSLRGHMVSFSVYFIRTLVMGLRAHPNRGDLILTVSGKTLYPDKIPAPRSWLDPDSPRKRCFSRSVHKWAAQLAVCGDRGAQQAAGGHVLDRRGGRNRDGGRMDSGA